MVPTTISSLSAENEVQEKTKPQDENAQVAFCLTLPEPLPILDESRGADNDIIDYFHEFLSKSIDPPSADVEDFQMDGEAQVQKYAGNQEKVDAWVQERDQLEDQPQDDGTDLSIETHGESMILDEKDAAFVRDDSSQEPDFLNLETLKTEDLKADLPGIEDHPTAHNPRAEDVKAQDLKAESSKVLPPSVHNEFKLKIRHALLENQKNFDMRLDPPHLGKIQVHLTIESDGRLSAVIRTENWEAQQMLKQDAHTLIEDLQNEGYMADEGSLAFTFSESEHPDNPMTEGHQDPLQKGREEEEHFTDTTKLIDIQI